MVYFLLWPLTLSWDWSPRPNYQNIKVWRSKFIILTNLIKITNQNLPMTIQVHCNTDLPFIPLIAAASVWFRSSHFVSWLNKGSLGIWLYLEIVAWVWFVPNPGSRGKHPTVCRPFTSLSSFLSQLLQLIFISECQSPDLRKWVFLIRRIFLFNHNSKLSVICF